MEAGVVIWWRDLLAASIVGAVAAMALPALADATCTGPEITNDCELTECLIRQCKQDKEEKCWEKLDESLRRAMEQDRRECRAQDRAWDETMRFGAPECAHLKRRSDAQLKCVERSRQRIQADLEANKREMERIKQEELEFQRRVGQAEQDIKDEIARLDREREWAEAQAGVEATPQYNAGAGASEETSRENDAYQDCVLRVQLASSLAFLTRSPGTAYFNAAAAGLRQCNALLLRRPVPAQTYQPESGSTYDQRSGNHYSWQRNYDGSTTVRGFNAETGSTWRQTIEPNGDQRGVDSRGNYWRYNDRTGSYWNSDGTTCFGKGELRRCF